MDYPVASLVIVVRTYTQTQTHTQTNAGERFTPTTVVGVSKEDAFAMCSVYAYICVLHLHKTTCFYKLVSC